MKNAKHYFFMFMALLLSACSSDLTNSIPLIEINPGFATSGFTDATVVSLNDTDTKKITYSRVYGISRALTMQLSVDENALNEYNTENNTSYKLLPAQYYTIPTSVTFDIKSKSADFDVVFKSKELYQNAGSVETASTYVLPIKATSEETKGVKVDEETNTVLLHVNMTPATVSVYVPTEITKLEFVANSGAVEDVTIEGTVNFFGFEGNYVSVEVVKDANLTLNGVDYQLLPGANYEFSNATLNELGEVVIKGKIDADGLSDGNQYLLPCRVTSSNPHYKIAQSTLIYYAIGITDLKVSITNNNHLVPTPTYAGTFTQNGSVNVTLNSQIAEELTVNFVYDPALVDAYNTSLSKNYSVLPAGSFTLENKKVPAGSKSYDTPFSIDMTQLADGVHYLVPLVLQENDLELGSVEGESIVYLDVAKTLVAEYNLDVIEKGRNRTVENTIWEASKCPRQDDPDWAAVVSYAQYGFGGDGDWYSVLFSVTDEDMPGKTNCKKIEVHTFLELLVSNGGTNNVTNNQSYYNLETGEIYFDFNSYESWFNATYKEIYSFTRK